MCIFLLSIRFSILFHWRIFCLFAFGWRRFRPPRLCTVLTLFFLFWWWRCYDKRHQQHHFQLLMLLGLLSSIHFSSFFPEQNMYISIHSFNRCVWDEAKWYSERSKESTHAKRKLKIFYSISISYTQFRLHRKEFQWSGRYLIIRVIVVVVVAGGVASYVCRCCCCYFVNISFYGNCRCMEQNKTQHITAQQCPTHTLSVNETSFSETISFTFSRFCHSVRLFVFVIVFVVARCAIFWRLFGISSACSDWFIWISFHRIRFNGTYVTH